MIDVGARRRRMEVRARSVAEAKEQLRVAKEQQVPVEVLEKAQGKVRVKRKNGEES
jgi:hypothetical protein